MVEVVWHKSEIRYTLDAASETTAGGLNHGRTQTQSYRHCRQKRHPVSREKIEAFQTGTRGTSDAEDMGHNPIPNVF